MDAAVLYDRYVTWVLVNALFPTDTALASVRVGILNPSAVSYRASKLHIEVTDTAADVHSKSSHKDRFSTRKVPRAPTIFQDAAKDEPVDGAPLCSCGSIQTTAVPSTSCFPNATRPPRPSMSTI